MAKHTSPKSAAAVGFHDGKAIYDWYGQIIGQLRGSHVYCMAGHHVGKLENGAILSQSLSKTQSKSPDKPNKHVKQDKNGKDHLRLRTRRP